ncbi:hypothetical protein AYO38_02955 [bacterium SCGC AG-212-C10]|nr:hypothetical protein AYO38_02955 [bacterium SCGC AG-212-C10]
MPDSSSVKVAIVYHSLEGQTHKIAEYIAAHAQAAGVNVTVDQPDTAPGTLAGYGGVIIAGSVHVGHHHKDLAQYVRDHRDELEAIPNALVSVSLTAVKHDPLHHEQAMGVVSGFVSETGWHPDQVALIGGALAYTQYGFIKRQVLKHIAKKEGATTDTSTDHSLTDWEAVDAFTDDFLAHVRAPIAP